MKTFILEFNENKFEVRYEQTNFSIFGKIYPLTICSKLGVETYVYDSIYNYEFFEEFNEECQSLFEFTLVDGEFGYYLTNFIYDIEDLKNIYHLANMLESKLQTK